MEVYLIRHSPVANPQKLCYGQSDIQLIDDWQTHFSALQNKLAPYLDDTTVYYSSPFARCTQLADFLSGNTTKTDARLSEMNFGDWEQCKWDNIEQSVLNAWMADFVHHQVPNGESFELMHQRCTQFWDELLNQKHNKIAIITHAGVIRSILAYVLQIPLDKIFQIEVDFCSISKVTVNQKHGCYQTVSFMNR